LDTEDHIIQRQWEPEQIPSAEELQKRHEMRKEQGRKLKERMQNKREDKIK
jgi:predicted nucleotidyltransferase